MYDLILKNGQIVTPISIYLGDILVKDGVIAGITSPNSGCRANRLVDVTGKYILPGLIDPHVHLNAKLGSGRDVHDFCTASKMAAFGGVTSFIDFSETGRGQSPFEAVKIRKNQMSDCIIDYSMHAVFVEAPENFLAEIKDIAAFGCPSIKMFTTYKGLQITDEDIIAVMEEAVKWGVLPIFHAENDPIAERNNRRFAAEGKLHWKYFPESKPNICEEEAVKRVISYAKYTGCPLHIFHLTTEEGANAIAAAQKAGVDITCETCPHYLMFTKEKNYGEDGYLYTMSPPLREQKDVDAMWRGLSDGTISNVGSDNCTFSRDMKYTDPPNYMKILNGVTGMEERIHVLMAKGVEKGRISISKLCEIASFNPAKIFGLYPQKGAIQPGSDADFCVYDPNMKGTVTPQTMHQLIDYNIYDGLSVKGWPVMTVRRGEILVENGQFKGEKGSGRFIVRKPSIRTCLQ